MTTLVHIDISSPEGVELVQHLKKYNSIVVFENAMPKDILNDKTPEEYGIDIRNKIKKDIIKTISVKIDVSTAEGQELLSELERHSSVVVIDNPVQKSDEGIIQKTYSVEEAFDNLYDKFQAHYGIDNPINEDGFPEETFSAEEIEKMVWDKLSDNYGIDVRKL